MVDKDFCKKCNSNAFFRNANKELCAKCKELVFEEVKEYIRENPDCRIKDILKNTDAKSLDIDKWIREGRLEWKSEYAQEYKSKLEGMAEQVKELKAKESSRADDQKAKVGFHSSKRR